MLRVSRTAAQRKGSSGATFYRPDDIRLAERDVVPSVTRRWSLVVRRVFVVGLGRRRWGNCGGKLKRGPRWPPFIRRERLLPFLASLLLPALGFLCHCLLSPPSCGFCAARVLSGPTVAAAWHAHFDAGARRLV